MFNNIDEYLEWAKILNISSIGELNDAIIKSKPGELINLSESIQDYRLQQIAKSIQERKADIKIILLSGPSSSGKTTSDRKLSMYLKTFGFDINDEVFAKHSWYFRNSLVRANYKNFEKNIFEDISYLEKFFYNFKVITNY